MLSIILLYHTLFPCGIHLLLITGEGGGGLMLHLCLCLSVFNLALLHSVLSLVFVDKRALDWLQASYCVSCALVQKKEKKLVDAVVAGRVCARLPA